MARKAAVAMLAAVLGLSLALGAGCGSKTTTTPKTTTPSTSPSTSSETISIVDFAFKPNSLTVAPGTTITWKNDGAVAHTVTSDTGVFDSGQLGHGNGFNFTFDAPGTYPYHCANHPSLMTATIIVPVGTTGGTTPNTTAPATPSPVNPTPTPQ
jgi:plastocyanin